MSEFIQVSDENYIRTVRFNRADKKNAITQEMYTAMAEAIESAPDAGMRAIVFLGQPGVYCAGNDIMDFMSRAMSSDMTATPTVRFLKALTTSKTPLVAGVDGVAIGVGVTMLMHCDFVVVSDISSLKTPFLNLGLVPEAASSLIGPKLMGHQRAFEMLIMGEAFDGARAKEAGLANRVVSSEDVEASALEAAGKIAALAPEALRISREFVRGSETDILARIDEEVLEFAKRLKSDEAREAFTAFMEKRPAKFG